MNIVKLPVRTLQRVLKIKRQIERLEGQLAKAVGGGKFESSAMERSPRRKMSDAGRAAISKAAKARWARHRAAQK